MTKEEAIKEINKIFKPFKGQRIGNFLLFNNEEAFYAEKEKHLYYSTYFLPIDFDKIINRIKKIIEEIK